MDKELCTWLRAFPPLAAKPSAPAHQRKGQAAPPSAVPWGRASPAAASPRQDISDLDFPVLGSKPAPGPAGAGAGRSVAIVRGAPWELSCPVPLEEDAWQEASEAIAEAEQLGVQHAMFALAVWGVAVSRHLLERIVHRNRPHTDGVLDQLVEQDTHMSFETKNRVLVIARELSRRLHHGTPDSLGAGMGSQQLRAAYNEAVHRCCWLLGSLRELLPPTDTAHAVPLEANQLWLHPLDCPDFVVAAAAMVDARMLAEDIVFGGKGKPQEQGRKAFVVLLPSCVPGLKRYMKYALSMLWKRLSNPLHLFKPESLNAFATRERCWELLEAATADYQWLEANLKGQLEAGGEPSAWTLAVQQDWACSAVLEMLLAVPGGAMTWAAVVAALQAAAQAEGAACLCDGALLDSAKQLLLDEGLMVWLERRVPVLAVPHWRRQHLQDMP